MGMGASVKLRVDAANQHHFSHKEVSAGSTAVNPPCVFYILKMLSISLKFLLIHLFVYFIYNISKETIQEILTLSKKVIGFP